MSKSHKAERIANSFEVIDALPGDLRACVHEFGYTIVFTLMKHGIRKPAVIREIVGEVWAGQRTPMQSSSTPAGLRMVDNLLCERGIDMNVRQLWRVLMFGGFTIAPLTPYKSMLEASMATVADHNIKCTKAEKHRLRYMAAVRAFSDEVNRQIEGSA